MAHPRLAVGALTAALAAVLACGGADEVEPDPEPIGPPVAELSPGWCTVECVSYGLHSDGAGLVELRAYAWEDGLSYAGSAFADLKPDTAASLEQLLDEALTLAEAGPLEDSPSYPCSFIDSPIIDVWPDPEATSDDDALRWDQNCPPAGLEQLHELLLHIVHNLADCTTTEQISPRIGCEPLNPWYEG